MTRLFMWQTCLAGTLHFLNNWTVLFTVSMHRLVSGQNSGRIQDGMSETEQVAPMMWSWLLMVSQLLRGLKHVRMMNLVTLIHLIIFTFNQFCLDMWEGFDHFKDSEGLIQSKSQSFSFLKVTRVVTFAFAESCTAVDCWARYVLLVLGSKCRYTL